MKIHMKLLTDEEYDKRMGELGFLKDFEFDRFFLDGNALLMNVD